MFYEVSSFNSETVCTSMGLCKMEESGGEGKGEKKQKKEVCNIKLCHTTVYIPHFLASIYCQCFPWYVKYILCSCTHLSKQKNQPQTQPLLPIVLSLSLSLLTLLNRRGNIMRRKERSHKLSNKKAN